ncbi:hypothetical protein JCM15765_26480 [Paradesulfitobacterium aromaticivorans]
MLIDGKTMRGSRDRDKATHIFVASLDDEYRTKILGFLKNSLTRISRRKWIREFAQELTQTYLLSVVIVIYVLN